MFMSRSAAIASKAAFVTAGLLLLARPSFAAAPIPVAEPVATRVLALTVDAPSPVAGVSIPVVGSVPLPRGDLLSARNVRILSPAGAEIPCQAKALAFWPEGSIKWLNLVFMAELPVAKPPSYTLEYGTNVTPLPTGMPLLVRRDSAGVAIHTGAASFRFAPGSANPLSTAEVRTSTGMRETLGGAGRGLYMALTDTAGNATRLEVTVTRLVVEEHGPVRAVVRAEALAAGGTRPIPITLRFHAYAGSTCLRIFHTFVFTCEPYEEFIEEIGYEFALPAAHADQPPREYLATDLDGRRISGLAAPLRLFQREHDRYEATLDGKPTEGGARLAGWLDAGGVAVAVRNFHRQYPKAFGLDASAGALDVSLWPSEAPALKFLHKPGQTNEGAPDQSEMIGVGKTHELLIFLHDPRSTPYAVAGVMAAFQRPPLPFVSPAWNAATRAVGFISPQRRSAFAQVEDSVELIWEFLFYNQANEPWYGMTDYGDMQDCFEYRRQTWRYLRGRWGWHAQMFHDLALYIEYLRTGDRRYFDAAEALTRHMVDVDTVHYERPDNHTPIDRVGSVHRHNAQHWVDIGEPKYTRINGWFLYYFLTGHDRTWDVLRDETIPFMANSREGRWRGTMTWGLLAAWEATGDAKYGDMVKQLTDVLIARQADDGWIDDAPNSFYFFVTGWADCLIEYYNLTGDERVEKAIVRLAERRAVAGTGQTWAPYTEAQRLWACAYRITGDTRYLATIGASLKRAFSVRPPRTAGFRTKREISDAVVALKHPAMRDNFVWKFDIIAADLRLFPYGLAALSAAP